MANCRIKYICFNVRGINNFKKRKKLFLWLDDQNIDFTFLQETHCVSGREKLLFSSWSGKSFQSNSNNPRSRGVAILVG